MKRTGFRIIVLWVAITAIFSGIYASAPAPEIVPLSHSASQPLAVTFKLLKVSGPIRYQLPLSGEWRVAKKGRYIPDGSVLMVPNKSNITIEANDSLGRYGIHVKSTKVTISEPMIVRLSRDSFRKVRVEKEMKTKLPDAKSMKALEKMPQAEETFLDAWKTMANTVMDKEPPDSELAKLLADAEKQTRKKDAVTVSSKTGRIVIVAPKEREEVMTKVLPIDISVRWQREGLNSDTDRSGYEVYFWKDDSPQSVYARVNGTRMTVKASSFGSYNLQVVSADGSYKSKVRKVKIGDQLKSDDVADAEKTPEDLSVEKTLSQRIKAISPGRNLVWHSKGDWPVIGFEWSRPETCAEQVLYKLLIKSDDGKVVFKRDINREQFLWTPPRNLSGGMTWQVEGLSCMSPDKKKILALSTTPQRRLMLVRGDPAMAISKAIAEPKFRGMIFLDSF